MSEGAASIRAHRGPGGRRRPRADAVVRARRDRVGRHNVAGSAAADRVDGRVVLVEEAVALQLLVEGEDGALAGGVDVAGSTAATEEAVGLRGGDLRRRGVEVLLLEAVVVTDSASARVVETAGGVDGRSFSDDGHFEDCVW